MRYKQTKYHMITMILGICIIGTSISKIKKHYGFDTSKHY